MHTVLMPVQDGEGGPRPQRVAVLIGPFFIGHYIQFRDGIRFFHRTYIEGCENAEPMCEDFNTISELEASLRGSN